MDLTLRFGTQADTAVVRLFKDRAAPRSDGTLACTVSCRGNDYRSDIAASDVDELVRLVRSVSVPAAGGCGMGLDGRYYELTIKNLMAEATYRWWEKPDPGWEPLVAIAGSLLNLGFQVSGQYLR
jgi:hypothetical protein